MRLPSPLIKELIKFAPEIKDEKDPNKICEKAKEVFLQVENAESLYKVGRIYSKYGKKDEAFEYFVKAADSVHKFAQYLVALHYYQQDILITNYEYVSLFSLDENKKIDTYYQLFDNFENIRNNIFLKYEHVQRLYNKRKQEIQNRLPEAIKYFKMAADNGSKYPQYELGIIYSLYKEDKISALNYFGMAAHNGHKKAIDFLNYYYQQNHEYEKILKSDKRLYSSIIQIINMYLQ